MATPVVEMQNVSKYFSRVIANKDVSISIYPGEVLALLGENGAGKSTIMKILYGLYGLDEGKINIRGKEVVIKSPKDAMGNGIAMIQQHFSLVPTHTATENIILGNVHGRVSLKEYDEKIKRLSEQYGFDIPVDKPVGSLAVGVQQKVEILKALYINANILIMDEPTAVLTPQESQLLMEFIKEFSSRGNSVIFITHKLKEVMEVANRVVVMRNGLVHATVNIEDTDERALAKMMVGQDFVPVERQGQVEYSGANIVLGLQDIRYAKKDTPPILDGITVDIYKGEVFGIAGVSGNGQDDLCEVIAGAKKQTSGKIIFCGKDLGNDTVRERIESGIGYVPLDRYRDGMIMDMTLAENMMLKSSFDKKWRKYGLIDHKKLSAYTQGAIAGHYVKATGPSDIAKSLSGGNQQKVVLAREVDIGEKIIIFNQPTRGLDMGAVDRIHKVILGEKEKGKAVLLISTELSEIFELCDRFAVMYKGRFMGIYQNGELTTTQIGLLMAGVSGGEGEAI